ncbi:hypothetical protein EMCRGX_G004228, partial [Ephydatia muelleri]
MSLNRKIYCCDPFHCHQRHIYARLRVVSEAIIAAHPSLSMHSGDRACCNCLNKLRKMSPDATAQDEEHASSTIQPGPSGLSYHTGQCSEPTSASADTEDSDTDNVLLADVGLLAVNEMLGVEGISPVRGKRKTRSNKYVGEKIRRVEDVIRKKVLFAVGAEDKEPQDDGREMIEQLKEKFTSTSSRSERLTVLTVLPKSWSIAKIMEEFGVTRYMAKSAKMLVEDKGVLSCPNSKAGKPLSESTLELVRNFYCHDDISRVMPGRKDFLSVRNADGMKVHQQKRLVLCNLREAYHQFKIVHPDVKIGFSKFSQLRPKECVLAGSSGTHTVCVCVIHQNAKLMMTGGRLEALTQGEFKHYSDCLAFIMCEPPTAECANGICEDCRGIEPLLEELQDIMEDNSVDTVQYSQWINTDRANLETHVLPVEDFLNSFKEVLKKLRLHDYIAKKQATFMSEKKELLSPGEYLVIADFSENYSFVVQDEVQSFHWNNLQATVHPFLCYYREINGKLNNICFTVISENKDHDSIAVHLFQKKVIEFLTGHFGAKPKRIVYMSDGCAGQYKNCYNFTNLCYHEEDFGVAAEWHFFATSHGKSAADGIGGTVKRTAAKASLQRPKEDQILTPAQLYQFVSSEIKGMHFSFATLNEHEEEARLLSERYKHSRTVPGTRSQHCVVPYTQSSVEVRQFSASPIKRIEVVSTACIVETLPLSSIKGYVTVMYDGHCWLGMVTKVDKEARLAEVNFLHPQLPAKSYLYPRHQDIMEIDPSDILTLVSPSTATGRTYSLTSQEIMAATRALEA